MSADVVVLVPKNEGRFAHTVYQEDLAALVELSRAFTKARLAWEKKRDYIKAALKSGAAVEPGAFDAEVVTRSNPGYSVEPFDYEMVDVR